MSEGDSQIPTLLPPTLPPNSRTRKRKLSPAPDVVYETPAKVARSSSIRTIDFAPASAAAMPSPVEANIQVVVRCRPPNEREERETSPSILSFGAVRSRELQICSSINDRNLLKKYCFDRVFAPDASQDIVYRDVVAPMLDEVIKGYNCTIFAYGQTGTGKTFTMEGCLEKVDGYHHPMAGVIPRALYNLFEYITESHADTTVKMSCVELYNEELRDLLSPPEDSRKLKIYDVRNGVCIQNAVETTITSAPEGLLLLQQACRKRTSASTILNHHSSRSHAVYTITVFTRETTETGEDLTRTGKLNLVDLAGSENIGRSGAENKRAREAGLINQSLLTLGRVINSLVEKSQHVPYRESKLTRLLQDSLGGRTKTCVIATVSSSRRYLEETQSTLDYAHRAKNIRNKPEINARVTSRSVIDKLSHENILLRADLKAAHEKNGITVSEERWAENTSRLAELETAVAASKGEIEMLIEQLNGERAVVMRQRASLVQNARRAEEDTHIIALVSEQNQTLHQDLWSSIKVASQASLQIEQLYSKIDQFAEHMATNSAISTKYNSQVTAGAKTLEERIQGYGAAAEKTRLLLQDENRQFLLSTRMYTEETSAEREREIDLIHRTFENANETLGTYGARKELEQSLQRNDLMRREAQFAARHVLENVTEHCEIADEQLSDYAKHTQGSHETRCRELGEFVDFLKANLAIQKAGLEGAVALGRQLGAQLQTETAVDTERIRGSLEAVCASSTKRIDDFLEQISTHAKELLSAEVREIRAASVAIERGVVSRADYCASALLSVGETCDGAVVKCTEISDAVPRFHREAINQYLEFRDFLLGRGAKCRTWVQNASKYVFDGFGGLISGILAGTQQISTNLDAAIEQRTRIVAELQGQHSTLEKTIAQNVKDSEAAASRVAEICVSQAVKWNAQIEVLHAAGAKLGENAQQMSSTCTLGAQKFSDMATRKAEEYVVPERVPISWPSQETLPAILDRDQMLLLPRTEPTKSTGRACPEVNGAAKVPPATRRLDSVYSSSKLQ